MHRIIQKRENRKLKIAVIIPCYNEEKNIAQVIREVVSQGVNKNYQLVPVVVNDKSSDDTQKIVCAEKCVLIDLPVNLGIGGAVQTGFKYAHEKDFDFAIQLDGDGQHPANEIEKILNPLLCGEADVVIGSRFIDHTGFQSSFLRRIGITFLEHLIKRFVHQNILDCTSGFRALNSKAIQVVVNDYPDDYPEPVSIIIFFKNKLRIKEVQVAMKERQSGKSSIRGFSQWYYMMKVSLSICFTFFKK